MHPRTFFAPAKLNLFLHVVGRRADGYHLLETVFQLVDFGDFLDIAVRRDAIVQRTSDLPGVPADLDLVVRAARLLQSATGTTLGADIAVNKRIPLGGGLGGGSSDAASTLLALNRLWELRLSRAELSRLALSLGADVPFFVFGRNAFARGIGEELTPVDLPERWFAVVVPAVQVPTAVVFGSPNLTRDRDSVKMIDFSSGSWGFPAPMFRNDLEPVACAQFEQVARALSWLRGFDAKATVQARMSGSGASVFAGYAARHEAEAVIADLPPGCAGFVARSLAAHPLAGCALD